MRIAIDVREACRPQPTGKGAWVKGCVDALLRHPHDFLLLSHVPLPSSWEQHPRVQGHVFAAGIQWHAAARKFLCNKRPDAYLSTTSFLLPACMPQGIPCVPVVHDLIAFRPERHERKAQILERMFLPRALRRAKHICSISEATKHDLCDRFPHIDRASVTPVYAGPQMERAQMTPHDRKGIVCIATLCPRKNQLRLIQAYAQLPEALRRSHSLILAGGRGWQDANIIALAEQTPNVFVRGYVSNDEYIELLSTCAVFAYPSLYEGFGLPVLDALQHGAPVVTSSRGSLQEVAGDAAEFVDPESVDSIAAALQRILSDDQLRERLMQQGPLQASKFSWDRTAKILLGVLSCIKA